MYLVFGELEVVEVLGRYEPDPTTQESGRGESYTVHGGKNGVSERKQKRVLDSQPLFDFMIQPRSSRRRLDASPVCHTIDSEDSDAHRVDCHLGGRALDTACELARAQENEHNFIF